MTSDFPRTSRTIVCFALLGLLALCWLPTACFLNPDVQCVEDADCLQGFVCKSSRCVCPGAHLTNCTNPTDNKQALCVDLKSYLQHCGSCFHACGSTEFCLKGQCQPCTTNSFCDNECVDKKSNPRHCGGCGNACPVGVPCRDGECKCPDGTILHKGLCIDLQSDARHCGEPENPCPDQQVCRAGACVPCPRWCGPSLCPDLQTDAKHCGSCGKACAAGESCCAGGCVDLQTDSAHCGQCSKACGTGQRCEQGQCVCSGAQTLCQGTCVDLNSDAQHCGACGKSCGNGKICSQGLCCSTGQTNCAGACVDLQTDPDHCGQCGRSCQSKSCRQGQCKACTTDTDCDASLSCDTGSQACFCGARCGWLQTAGAAQADISPQAVALDTGRDVYITGSWKGEARWGTYTRKSHGDDDIFLARLDDQGRIKWVQVFGSKASDTGTALVIHQQTIYLTGSFRSSMTIGSWTLSSRGDSDIFVAALDLDGKVLWVEQAGGPKHDESRAITVDSQGSLYLTGIFGAQAGFGSATLQTQRAFDMFVARLQPGQSSRRWRWVTSPGGKSVGTSIAVRPGVGVFVAGEFQESIQPLSGKPLQTQGTPSLMVLKFQEDNGDLLAGAAALGTSSARGLALCPNGELFVVGSMQGSIRLGDITVNLQRSQDVGDILVAQLDTNLTFQHGMAFSDKGFGEAVSSVCDKRYLWVTGFFQDAVTWKDAQDTNSQGANDIFLLQLDHTQSTGPSVTKAYSLGSSKDDQGSALTIAPDGGLFMTGWFQGDVAFPTTSQTTRLQGFRDAFLWKVAR